MLVQFQNGIDDTVVRVILTRNCVIGNNGVGCMRDKT